MEIRRGKIGEKEGGMEEEKREERKAGGERKGWWTCYLPWNPHFNQISPLAPLIHSDVTDQPCLDHGVSEVLGQVWMQEEILKRSEGEDCSAVGEKVTWPGDVPPTPRVMMHWEEQYSCGHDT